MEQADGDGFTLVHTILPGRVVCYDHRQDECGHRPVLWLQEMIERERIEYHDITVFH